MEGINFITNFAPYFILPVLMVIGVFLLVRPHMHHKNSIPRKKIAAVGTMSILAGFIGFTGVLAMTNPTTHPDTDKSHDVAVIQHKDEVKPASAKPVVAIETVVEPIPFAVLEQTDSKMVKGQTRLLSNGSNGERTITYEVTRLSGQEKSRKELKNVVTIAAVSRVTVVGTYIPKIKVIDASTKSPTPKPSSVPKGATALCKDGTYSFSTSRRTACTFHGGVAKWL